MNDVPASSYRPAPEGVGRGRLALRRDQASSSRPTAVSVDQTKTAEADELVEPGGTITEAPDPQSPASPDAETSPERS